MTTDTRPPTPTPRRHDIDALRGLAVLLGVLFHSARAFNLEPWHVQNAELSVPLDLFVHSLTPWRMPLLFLLAGSGTFFALGRRGGAAYAGERCRRLLLPLAVGMLTLIPVQVYAERIAAWCATRTSPIDFRGSFLEFYPSVFTAGAYPEGNLSWHHLWFIAYLFLYSLVLLPLFLLLRGARGAGGPVTGAIARAAAGHPAGVFLPLPLLFLVEATLRPRFPGTNAMVEDWANHAHYLILFLLGFLLVADSRLGDAVDRRRRLALGAVLALAPLRLWLIATGALPADGSPLASLPYLLRTTVEWCGLLAILAYGRRALGLPHPALRRLSALSYPIYIWHQPVIVVVALSVLPLELGVGAKFVVLSAVSLALTVLLSVAVQAHPLTRVLFGLKAGARPSLDVRAAQRPSSPLGEGENRHMIRGAT